MISIADVSKTYPARRTGREDVTALEHVSLDVRDGEFVSLVGASGCGKTTLLKMIAGLILPTAGSVSIEGSEVDGPSQHMAMAFQGNVLLPWRSVLSNIEIGLEARSRGLAGKERRARAEAYCRLVGLERFQNAYPYELSGGMQQRVNLARAFAVEAPVLLMDEPFAALDAQTRELMQQELLRIWEQTKRTVVFVTHQIEEALYLSDRVIVLRSSPGRVLSDMEVPFKRPRELQIKRSAEFGRLAEALWSQIEGDVKASFAR